MCVYFQLGTDVRNILQSARDPFLAFYADVSLSREFVLARVGQECQLAHGTSFLRSANIPRRGGVCALGWFYSVFILGTSETHIDTWRKERERETAGVSCRLLCLPKESQT